MYKDRKAYLEYRHRKWAAGVIALTWVMNVKMATMKKQLKVTRKRELENFKERTKASGLNILHHDFSLIFLISLFSYILYT